MKKILTIALILLSGASASTAAAFLENGVGARSEAMGRAFTAVADDLDAFYYNPAGYAFQKNTRINTLSSRINNIQDVFSGGVGLPLGRGYLAFNAYTAYLGDIKESSYVPGASDQNYIQETGDSFSSNSTALYLSYALGLENFNQKLEGFSLGLNLKQISETLYENSARGSGVDFGLMYRANAFSVGYTMVNFIEPQMTWDTESGHIDVVERLQRAGAAYTLLAGKLTISAELLVKRFEALAGLGLEYLLNEYFALRTGSFNESYALGFGFKYKGFNFDYAYVQPLEDLIENTHKFSLGYLFESSQPNLSRSTKKQQKVIIAVPLTESSIQTVSKTIVTAEQQVERSIVEEENLFTETFLEIQETIALEKKSIILTEDKVKCFYKLVNNSAEQVNIKYTIMLVDSRGSIVETKTSEVVFAPKTTDLINEQLAVGLDLVRGEYKVKAFFRWQEAEMLTDLETIYKK